MSCPGCGRENRPDARFCNGCGASLAPRCPACGVSNDRDARFCDACGADLAAKPPEKAIARKVVTVVFADLIGSMSLHERLDPESARRAIDRYHRAMTAAVEVHGGHVVQLLGDGVLAAFGVPRVAEDDALRAVRAAAGMQRAFRELLREESAPMHGVGLRVAVNTGEVVVSDDETAVIGDPTNVAARLQQEARDGDVLVGEATQRLVADQVTLEPLGSFALRGRSETVAAYRVVSLDRPAGLRATAFVGREEEIGRLLALFEDAVGGTDRAPGADPRDRPGARLAVLLGSPGLGKSRLVAELVRRIGERATVVIARCDSSGGATFAPIVEAFRSVLRVEEGVGGEALRAAIDAVLPGDEAERARIYAGIAALFSGAPTSPEETFFAVRRLLGGLAATRPVVLVIDDLHWAEPLLLDLLEHLVQWSPGVPLFLLGAARPELREVRSSLAASGPLVADVVTLGGLDAAASMRLAAGVLGTSELPAALVGRVLATSEGNPLFLAELVRMLVQDGTLRREGERWVTTVEVSKLEMPPTIQVLLAARLERLKPEERIVLERAAVIGRQFSRSLVAHLLAGRDDTLDARLEALKRSELIEPDGGWFLGEPALRFHHALIRDAAYRRLLKETRAGLHERLADGIRERVGEAVEHEEMLGWHLEQAHRSLRELGLLDARGRELGERAARHLGAAGRRALARDDLALACGLLERAIGALEPGHAARAEVALDWCEALLSAGEVGSAGRAIEELGHGADSDRLRAWHACFAAQLAALTDSRSLRSAVAAVAVAAEMLAVAGDAAGEAKAHSVHSSILARLGEFGACEAALDRALAAARRARDRRRANAVLAGSPVAALWGPSAVARASGRCLDVVRVLRITEGSPAVEAVSLRCQAVLEVLRGRADAARRMIETARRMAEELGIAQQLLETDVFAGLIELLEGNAGAAEAMLRTAYEGLLERGLGTDAARAAALLGRALFVQGRTAEALVLSYESEALAGDDLKAAMGWRGVRALALAGRGEHADAIFVARRAVEIAAETDGLLDHADARIALATALRAAGRDDEADEEVRRAIDLWEEKGATSLVERAQGDAARFTPDRDRRADPNPARGGGRAVRANFATEHLRDLDAVVAARDLDAFARLLAPEIEVVHHPAGAFYGHGPVVERFRGALRDSEAVVIQHVPLATLGDAAALSRVTTRARGSVAGDLDFLWVLEADASARATRVEVFAGDDLAGAIARLYERHAERLPEGAARERAASTARSITTGLRVPSGTLGTLSPDVEFVDHRRLGLGSARGVEAFARADRAQRSITSELSLQVQDVLALQAGSFLVAWKTFGTNREGGRFENDFLMLRRYGGDGLLARMEWFDLDHADEALARFDELADPEEGRGAPARRVHANAGIVCGTRVETAIAARDAAALDRLLCEGFEAVNHPHGAVYDRSGLLWSWTVLLQAEAPVLRNEPLGALGGALALFRQTVSISGIEDGSRASAGESVWGLQMLVEGDPSGRCRRSEVFAGDRLGDAIARLYARHAELLPEGPERHRADVIARSLAVLLGPLDLEHWRGALAPDVMFVDRRRLGSGPGRGADPFLQGLETLLDASVDSATRVEDVLALEGDALLLRWTNYGTDRATGGTYERPFLLLLSFGGDGRLAHWAMHDADRIEEAFEHLDALASATLERTVEGGIYASDARGDPLAAWLRPNAATAAHDRVFAAVAERDWAGMHRAFSPDARVDDRRRLTRTSIDVGTAVDAMRVGVERAPDSRIERRLVAVFGDRVCLEHQLWHGTLDGGAFEMEMLALCEADAEGRVAAVVDFDVADGLAAHRAGNEHWMTIEPELAPLLRTSDAYLEALRERSPERARAFLADDLVVHDRRRTGYGLLAGADAFVESLRAEFALTRHGQTELPIRLAIAPFGSVALARHVGALPDGGAFERLWCTVSVIEGGRFRRLELFELDDVAEALARFAELRREREARREG